MKTFVVLSLALLLAICGAYVLTPSQESLADAPTPTIISISPNPVEVGTQITLHASATDNDGDQVQIRVDWNDGTIDEYGTPQNSGSTFTLNHTYAANGQYTVTVTAKDINEEDCGCSATELVEVTNPPNDPPETANVSASGNEDEVIAVTLTGTDTDGSVDQFYLDNHPPNGALFLDAATTNPANAGSAYAATTGNLTLYFKPDANWSGNTQFKFAAIDDNGTKDSTSATASIAIAEVNDPPDAVDDDYSVERGNTLNESTPGVLGNDIDPDSSLTAAIITNPSDADSFTLNTDGSFSYTHNGSLNTSDSFTYIANDGTSDSNEATVTITIESAPPVAIDDDYTVDEESSLNEAAPGVLINDTDPETDPLTVTLETDPLYDPAFSLNPDGSFTYTHDGSETISDSFTYIANDGTSDSNAATVTITINPTNDPPTGINLCCNTVDEGQPIGTRVGDLETADVDSNTFTYTLVSGDGDTDNASFQIAGSELQTNAIFEYAVQNSFSIRIQTDDGSGGTSEDDFTITVNEPNYPPTDITLSSSNVEEHKPAGEIVGTFSTTDESSSDTHTYSPVNGDGDTDNASFAISNADILTAEEFNYETKNSYSIRVETNDGNGGTFQKSFTIAINDGNDPPIGISPNTLSVNENASDDTSIDVIIAEDLNTADTHNFTITSQEHTGAFSIGSTSGEITVADASQLDYETDSSHNITIEATDSGGLTYSETISIDIQNINEAPLAATDSYSVIRGNSLGIPSPGVLGNDSDPENDSLTAKVVDEPNYGTVTLVPNGSFTYTHDGSQTPDTDYFTYQANDGALDSEAITVTITITPPTIPAISNPTATSFTKVSATLGANVTSDGGTPITQRGIVWSTSIEPTLQDCSGSETTTGTTGIFTISATGLEIGTTYHYRGFATNSEGTSYTADATFSTAPRLSNIKITSSVNEGSAATLSGSITAATSTTLSINWGDGSNIETKTYSSTTTEFNNVTHIYADGPESHTINLTLTDVDGSSDTTSISLTVEDVPPTVNISGSPNPVDEGSTFTLTISEPVDPGSDTITKYRVFWGDTTNQEYTNRNNITHVFEEAASSVTIIILIFDEDTNYNAGEYTLKVTNVTPKAIDDSYATNENSSLTINASSGLLANDTNPADEPLRVSSVNSSATNGTVTDWNDDGSFTYKTNGAFKHLEDGETATDTFSYTLTDGDGSTDTATVVITINGYTHTTPPAPEPSIYSLNITTVPEGSGSVILNPSGDLYMEDTVVILEAVPGEGNLFTSWSGDLTGGQNPETITINSNKTITASFVATAQTSPTTVSTGTKSSGTPTQTGTSTGEGENDSSSGGMTLWIYMGPLLAVGIILAIIRFYTIGGFTDIRKSWTKMKARYS